MTWRFQRLPTGASIPSGHSELPRKRHSCGPHRHLVRALGFVKQAAATANSELGLICPGTVEAIVAACERIRAGEVDAEFCVDVIQGGAGTAPT